MLSWQQAAVLAAGLFVAGLLLVSLARAGAQPGRSPGRAARWAAHVGPFAREAGVVTALYALWQLAGNLAAGGLNVALGHAWWIWDTERSLGLPSELAAQRLLLPHPLLSQVANLYYATMHFGVLIAMLIWLFFRHRDAYPAVRNAMAASTAICLLISFIPVAPPRMLTPLGFVDLAARYGESVYGAAGGKVGADQLSAMPSVHVCWSVLVAWAVITASTSRWRWLILAHPIVTVFVVVATGNHYWADAIVSVAIVGVVLAVQALVRARLAWFRRAVSGSTRTPAPSAPGPAGSGAAPAGAVSVGEKQGSQPLGAAGASRSAAQGGLALQVRQLLWVAHGVEPGDEAVVDPHRHHAVDLAVEPQYQRRVAVDLSRMQRRGAVEPAKADRQQAGDLAGSDDGPGHRLLDPAAVAEQDDVRREDVEQALQIPRLGRPLERVERRASLDRGDGPARPPRRDVRARPVRDLADGGRALVDRLCDLVVFEVEHLAQHEYRPLGRRERLEHQQHRHRDTLGQLDVLGHVGRGQQRLGQPRADVGLLAAAERAQPGESLAGGDPDQVRAEVAHPAEIHPRPAQPGLLQDVLRVGGGAEHLVGNGEQQVAVGEERLGGGIRAGHGQLLFALGRFAFELFAFDCHTHQMPGPAGL
jgi:hypothetical protein